MRMPLNAPSWLHQFGFDRVDRAPFELRLDEDHLTKSLDRMCQAITDEIRVRRPISREHREYQPPRGWMKTVCYNAILTCMYYEVFDELVARHERYDRFERGPQAERSAFDDALKGIFAHERLVDGKELLDRKDRKRMADEIWWGFRHYMEPSEIVAFNRDHPFHRDENVSRKMLAPSLYRHIVKRRFFFGYRYDDCGELEEYRGPYPQPLQERVDRLGERHWARTRMRRRKRDDHDVDATSRKALEVGGAASDGWDEDDLPH